MAKQKIKVLRSREAAHKVDASRFVREQFDRPELRALSIRIDGLRRDGVRESVDLALEVGHCLQLARGLLQAKGLYSLWVRQVLRSDPRTAYNQTNLAKLAEAEPKFVEECKELGLAKLYRLALLTPEARQEVMRTPHLERLTDREFSEVLRPHRPVHARKVTPRMKAHGTRMKLNAWTDHVKSLPTPRLAPAEREALRDDYQRLVDALLQKIAALK